MHLKLGSPRKRRMSKSKSLATLTDSKIEQNGKVPYTSYTSLRNLLNIENEGRKEQENYRTRRCYTCSSSTLLSRHGKENPAKTTQSLRKQSISSPCLQLLNNICTPSLLRKALENSISEDLQYQADFDDSCSSQCSSDGSKGSFEDFGVYQISTRNGIQRGSFNLPIRKTSSCVDISFPFGVGKLRKISNAFSKSEKTLNRSERTLNRSERTLNRSVRRRVSKRRRRYCSESQKSSDSGISKSESGRDVFSVYDNVDTKIADDDGDDATQEDDVFTEEPRHYLKIGKEANFDFTFATYHSLKYRSIQSWPYLSAGIEKS